MPQASEEARSRYRQRFGDIDAGHAVTALQRAGFKLTKVWTWIAPPRPMTEDEMFWLAFLCDEWDFGWLEKPARARCPQHPRYQGKRPPRVGCPPCWSLYRAGGPT